LSPDNNVQAPTNSQNLNRYSYCLNNPLSLYDPSGYTWFSRLGDWLGSTGKRIVITYIAVATAVGVSIATAGMADIVAAAFISGFCVGLATGAASAALNGQDVIFGAFSSAFVGGFTSMAMLGVGAALSSIGRLPQWTGTWGKHSYFRVGPFWIGQSTGYVSAGIEGISNRILNLTLSGSLSGYLSSTLVTDELLSKFMEMPDLTRDWLEYNAHMNNAYNSSGTLDWIHYDTYGMRSVTSFDAVSGTSPKANFPSGGMTINEGKWEVLQLENIPYNKENIPYYSKRGEIGYKVRLKNQFGRTGILIHPAPSNGTLGCIGLRNVNECFDFYFRIKKHLSLKKNINVYVKYY
ncbi:MAG: hypothetical protein ACP5PZ_12305, partial [Bacteroidales bacterium]